MRNVLAALVLVAAMVTPARSETEVARAVTSLYERFAAAQNARDAEAVRALLWNSPDFVWISDGKAFWGADRMIQRMSAFQRSDIWEVVPDRARARVVEVSPVSAVLFQPLTLTLGPRADPRTIAFLVNVLCVQTPDGWRIAALYTTDENP